MSGKNDFASLIVLAPIVSALAPLILIQIFDPSVPFAQKLIIGFLSVILGIVLNLRLDTAEVVKSSSKNNFIIDKVAAFLFAKSQHLESIYDSYKSIVSRDAPDASNDIFVQHFGAKIQSLKQELDESVRSNVIAVSNHRFASKNEIIATLMPVSPDRKREYRFVWRVLARERLFNENDIWEEYFNNVIDLLGEGKIDSIKPLLVLENRALKPEEVYSDRRISLLFNFFLTNKIECRYVSGNILKKRFKNDLNLDTIKQIPDDFGIFSDRYLFRGYDYNKEAIGDFSRDQKLIKSYTDMFDSMWDGWSTVVKPLEGKFEKISRVADLYNLDKELE